MNNKSSIIFIISIFILYSCKSLSYQEKFPEYFEVNKQLDFIKSNLTGNKKEEFQIVIRHGHNTINILKSTFNTLSDSVQIKTTTKKNYEYKIDTTFTVSKEDLFNELLFQKKNAPGIVVLAGHYQEIYFKQKEKSVRYPTTRVAKYLIEFLEDGKFHF